METYQTDQFDEPTFQSYEPDTDVFAQPEPPQNQMDETSPDKEMETNIPQQDGNFDCEKDWGTNNWKKHRVRAGDHIEEDEVLLMFGEHTFASRGNIQTLSGKPKSCKTFLISAMAGACMAGEYMGIATTNKDLKILIFDTEQGKARAQTVLRRVYRMCELCFEDDSDRLDAISVRELDPQQRLNTLIGTIIDTKPDLVFLDGVRDLLTDFNDIKQSAEIVNVLMKLSVDYQCAIITVIHQNKGDANARGHLGSELMNKSETAAEVVRADKISTVKPVFCRNEEFDDFSFRINGDGLPVLCDVPVKKEDKSVTLRNLLEPMMIGTDQILRVDLRKKLEDNGLKDKTATRRINEAIKLGVLELIPDNDKMVRLVVNPDYEPTDELDEDAPPF